MAKFSSKSDRRDELLNNKLELKETISDLNEKIMRHKKKKAIISKELSDYSAELVYYRNLIKETITDLKEL
jgi:hypothetical protein